MPTFVRILLLLCPVAASAALVRIDLPPAAFVEGTGVRLGHVARVSSSEPELVRRLASLPLGTLDARAEGILLDRMTLARWIRSQTGLRDDQVEWIGESTIRVTTIKTSITAQVLRKTAEDALRSWLTERTERFEIRPVTRPSDIVLHGNAVRVLVKPIREERPLPRMQVLVDIVAETGLVRTVPLSFDVTAHARGLVIERDVEAGHNPSDVIREDSIEITAARVAGKPVSGSDLGTGPFRLRRAMRAGEVMLATDLEHAPAIQRGTWITLRLSSGSLLMESRAEALQDGNIGQSVRVKPSGAERSILARVSGIGMVEVNK